MFDCCSKFELKRAFLNISGYTGAPSFKLEQLYKTAGTVLLHCLVPCTTTLCQLVGRAGMVCSRGNVTCTTEVFSLDRETPPSTLTMTYSFRDREEDVKLHPHIDATVIVVVAADC